MRFVLSVLSVLSACGSSGPAPTPEAPAPAPEAAPADPLLAACAEGHPTCLPAADAARTAGDSARAAELYAAACKASPESAACLLAARGTGAAPPGEAPPWPAGDPAAVSAALWARCAANEAWGCLQLAEHVERHGGPLPAEARGDATWLRNQACDLQLTYACAPHAW